ncbi:hypothetical protein PUN28_005499 [Cardiocondyla obscurior]|uniref:Uncharacterized protein n=1 Tax=Cardiocondyla obscurior TaxID=286306 RepID=A0AAW2GI29_9HYME
MACNDTSRQCVTKRISNLASTKSFMSRHDLGVAIKEVVRINVEQTGCILSTGMRYADYPDNYRENNVQFA